MRYWPKQRPDRSRICWLLPALLALGLGACNKLGTEQPGKVSVLALQANPAGAGEVELQIELGAAYYAALHSGLSMTLHWDLQLVDPNLWWSRTVWRSAGSRVIGYRSLRQQYTLTDHHPDSGAADPPTQRFPSSGALEQALKKLPIGSLPTLTDDQQLRFRLRLDADSLPPPMRLPARVNPIWWLDSKWQTLSPVSGV